MSAPQHYPSRPALSTTSLVLHSRFQTPLALSGHISITYARLNKKAAEKAGVSCDTDYVTSSHPYEMIIKAAEKKGCDLIMMASHGRRGLQGLLIGSETHKVLTHTKIPVLVFR